MSTTPRGGRRNGYQAHITDKGRELAEKLYPAIGYTREIAGTCSLICRSAVTLHHLAEAACNGHPANGDPYIPAARASELQAEFEVWVERRQEQVERRLDSLVRDLPETDAGPWKFKPEQDPRGCSAIAAPADGIINGDSWGDHNAVTIPR